MQTPISDRKEFMVILIRVEINQSGLHPMSAKWTKKIEVAT
jgi:hypothetical protein